MRYKLDYEYSSLPSGTKKKNTAARVIHTRKVTRGGKKASPASPCQVRGNFRAHSRISPTLTRSAITE